MQTKPNYPGWRSRGRYKRPRLHTKAIYSICLKGRAIDRNSIHWGALLVSDTVRNSVSKQYQNGDLYWHGSSSEGTSSLIQGMKMKFRCTTCGSREITVFKVRFVDGHYFPRGLCTCGKMRDLPKRFFNENLPEMKTLKDIQRFNGIGRKRCKSVLIAELSKTRH